MLSISVLGPLVVRRGGEVIRIPAGKTSELLVRLALEPGGVVRRDRLVEDLWGDEAVATKPNTLQSKVAKLRRALGPPNAIVSEPAGYRLAVEPAQLDAHAALTAATEASRLLLEGDDRGAAAAAAQALSLFSGDVLTCAGGAPWAEPHRARLEAAHTELVEASCTARLHLGEASAVAAALEVHIADHPFHERLWALLATALYRAGRPADALAACQRARTVLVGELGLDPGPELQALEGQILAHDAQLADGRPTVPSLAPVPPSTGNLPALAVPLIGRSEETAAVVGLVARHRLVEVVGPGGVGKTALALAVGRALTAPGGVWLVRLEAATTASDVIDATVAALGVAGGDGALIERLRGVPTVLVVDNCEHVLAEAAEWIGRLLDATAAVRIVTTSQAPLELPGSVVLELEPLATDDAVALFTERAATHRSARAPAPEADGVRTLCLALDGLPLAIELAAARTRTLSVEEITGRLDDRFLVLSDPASRRPERRRALRATIAWSYDLLFPDDQRGLWALATFAGGAPLPAVEYVLTALGVPAPVCIDVLGRLAARSLLLVEHHDRRTRYRLLDSIRAFALEAMTAAGAANAALDAHARWFADVAAATTPGVRSARQAEHLAVVRDERANIDAALAWSVRHDPRRALGIAAGFGWAWVVLGDSRGAHRLLTAIAAAGPAADADVRTDALLLAGWIEASTGDLEPARRHVEDAAALADATADRDRQARAAYHLAYVVSHHGDFRAGLALTDRSRELYGRLDRAWDLAANGLFAARAAISAGDSPRAAELAEATLGWLRAVDDPWLHVRGEAMRGELARLQHDFAAAVAHLATAAETSHRLGFQQTEAYQVASLGRAQCQAGDYDAGAGTLARAVEQAEAIGDVRLAALARVHLGRVLRALGRADAAVTVLQPAVEWHRRAGGGEQARLGECLLAALQVASGDGAAAAADRLEPLLADARAHDDAPAEVFALDALARHAAARDDDDRAAALLATADERMGAAAHFIAARDRVDAAAVRPGPP